MIEKPEFATDLVDDEREHERVIRDRAYAIWCEKGCPEGQDREHWLTAEHESDASDVAGKGGAQDERAKAQPSART